MMHISYHLLKIITPHIPPLKDPDIGCTLQENGSPVYRWLNNTGSYQPLAILEPKHTTYYQIIRITNYIKYMRYI